MKNNCLVVNIRINRILGTLAVIVLSLTSSPGSGNASDVLNTLEKIGCRLEFDNVANANDINHLVGIDYGILTAERGNEFTDDLLLQLRDLKNLKFLRIASSKITDRGLTACH